MDHSGSRVGARIGTISSDFIYDQLKREAVRLRSFEDWDHAVISGADLAKAGFFYIHESDRVQCAFCLGILGRWLPGDIPMIEHRRCFSYCPFACGHPCGNIPIEIDSSSPLSSAIVIQLVSGGIPAAPSPRSTRSRPNSLSPPRQSGRCSQISSPHMTVLNGSSLSELGITAHDEAVNSKYVTVDSRLSSFKDKWPMNKSPKPDELAEAGWYFADRGNDTTACFQCGGVVQSWEATDNPWVEHARWFPDCGHVLLVKGRAFIERIWKQKAGEKAEPPKEPTPTEEEENIPEDMLCKICVANKVALVFLPCSHLCACVQCASSLAKCPICREPFKGYVRVSY